jgi:acyl-CoA synthetase (AMP-forming)/AMP-acid ligase II/acyl carrier protein
VLQCANLVFDASAEEIYPCLTAGATLVLRDDAMLRSGTDFAAGCRAAAVTVADLPSGFLQEMIEGLESSGTAWPPTLRRLVIGGERTLPERVAPLRRAVGPRVEILNTYGPTETTVVATAHAFRGDWQAVGDGHEIPIGRPIANLRAYVADIRAGDADHARDAGDAGNIDGALGAGLAPAGVPGELLIGGAGLARGYLGRPDLTARAFVPDPWSAVPGARLYRTGDLVRRRVDGDLEFLGRIDFQVKIRGYRIELGDIEAALVGHPAVGDAVVVAYEPQPGNRRLAAYWTPRQTPGAVDAPAGGPTPAIPDANPPAADAASLRAYLKEHLPEYMLPASFLQLTALPRNAGGKVDRRALPPPEPAQRVEERPYVAPRSEAEEAVAAIWSELLGVERVGVDDDFYALGGHSMSLVQVRHRIQREFGVEVALRSLVEENTVAALALVVEDLLLAQIEAELETAGGG